MTQFLQNPLGMSNLDPRKKDKWRDPDTDSRYIKVIDGDLNVKPNLMHDHTRYEYISPVGNVLPVHFQTPINTENRSLHWWTLDNSNNLSTKDFSFTNTYIFLDDPGNLTNTYTLNPGEKRAWFGAWIRGKMYFREASDVI